MCLGKKISEMFPLRVFPFVCCKLIVYQSVVIIRNLSWPEKFQVARLYYIVSKISFKKIEFHTKIRCNQIHIDELRLSIFHRVST